LNFEAKNFDFVIVPEHDSVIGSNVIQTKGAIHYLTNSEIDKNSQYLKSIIKKDERKVISLIMGGPTKYYDYSKENINKIFNDLEVITKKENFQLVIIPSMRTPKNIIQAAKDFFGEKHTVIEDIDKKAYLSALAISEFLFVTCDSSSMISEAALTGKPIYIANISDDGSSDDALNKLIEFANISGNTVIPTSIKIEQEIAILDEEERKEYLELMDMDEPVLNKIIFKGYELLGLQTYFTAGPQEIRAWTIKNNSTAPNAAGVIHTDFERGFIKAEVISFEDYISCNGESGSKEKGKLRLEGKEYIVKDGDVIHFKFNV